jgi:hypothetical protein
LKVHPNVVKSIAKFLDQKDINHLLASSRRCDADVRGENLTTFTEGRGDTLILETPEKLNEFLTRRTDYLYVGEIKLDVSIHNEEELRMSKEHSQLFLVIEQGGSSGVPFRKRICLGSMQRIFAQAWVEGRDFQQMPILRLHRM